MRIVLDTNVFVSGVFFGGPPYLILQAWRNGNVQLVGSREIFEEYELVGRRLAEQFPGVSLESFLTLLFAYAHMVEAHPLPRQICSDPDDDKFLACALAGKCRVIVSGDRALLKTSGYRRLQVVTPRTFVDQYL